MRGYTFAEAIIGTRYVSRRVDGIIVSAKLRDTYDQTYVVEIEEHDSFPNYKPTGRRMFATIVRCDD